MRTSITIALTVQTLLVVAAPQARALDAAQVAPRTAPIDRVPGRAILKLKDVDGRRLAVHKSSDHVAATALKNLSARTGVDVTIVRPLVLGWALVDVRSPGASHFPTESETLALVTLLAQDAAVESVTDDKWMRPLALPNDPGTADMWHLEAIDAEGAWDLTTGTTAQRVGVVDTGVLRNHEDFAGRLVGGHDFITGNNADGGGRDTDYNDPGDFCGSGYHGTHTAGTIGAAANNNTGIPGLNWNAGLVIVRALDSCGGALSDIGEGAAWLAGADIGGVPSVGANKVSVMNLSLGSPSSCSGFEQDVVDFVNEEGAIFVAAAGNDSGPVGSPANCNGALAVAAHGPGGAKSPYSSFGAQIDIVAPGGDQGNYGQEGGVLSTIGPNADYYQYLEGTSMAAPHVAGVVSLMQARDSTLTLNEIVSTLQSTGASCTNCNGVPRLVAGAAVAAIGAVGEGEGEPPPVDPTDDVLEENDDYTQAKSGVGCNITRDDLFAAEDDQDWYLLEVGADADVQITMTTPSGADLDLYLTDGPSIANDTLAASESVTGNESITWTSTGGTFRVVVNPYFDQGAGIHHSGAYTLAITCTGGDPVEEPPVEEPPVEEPPVEEPPVEEPETGVDPNAPEDALEENDTPAEAQELFCEEERTLTARDDDWFKIDVRDGDRLAAMITADGLPLDVTILDGDTELVAGSASDSLRTEDLPAGTYLVKVAPVGDGGVYRMKLSCNARAPFKLKPKPAGCSAAGETMPVLAFAALALLLVRRRRA